MERAPQSQASNRGPPVGRPTGARAPGTVLRDILRRLGRDPSECVYIGDNLMKDVAMAQDAKILAVHATYGGVQHKVEYDLLRKVSHWTEADVQREKANSGRTVIPAHAISRFTDIGAFFGVQL